MGSDGPISRVHIATVGGCWFTHVIEYHVSQYDFGPEYLQASGDKTLKLKIMHDENLIGREFFEPNWFHASRTFLFARHGLSTTEAPATPETFHTTLSPSLRTCRDELVAMGRRHTIFSTGS